MCGSERDSLGVSPLPPPCLKQGLWPADAYARLAECDPRDPPISAPCLLVAEIADTRSLCPHFTLVPGI